jgi:hypothetical protein
MLQQACGDELVPVAGQFSTVYAIAFQRHFGDGHPVAIAVVYRV